MMLVSRRSTLPVTTFPFFISAVIVSLLLPSFAAAVPASAPGPDAITPAVAVRRHDMHEHEPDQDQDAGKIASTTSHTAGWDTHASITSTEFATIDDIASMTMTSSISTPSAHAHPPDPHAHDHGSHAVAQTDLDDVYIHQIHQFPPTYLDADFRLDADSAIFGEEFDETWDAATVESHKSLMAAYVVGMCGAYFGALPISLALRAADHPSHYIANAVFIVIAVLGWLAGAAYRTASIDRYEGAIHWPLANVLLFTSLSLAVLDSVGLIKRAVSYYRQHEWSWSSFFHDVLRASSSEDKWAASRYEMVGLVEHEDDQNQVVFAIGDEGDTDADDEHEHNDEIPQRTLSKTQHPRRPSLLIRQWTPPSRASTGSDGTLRDSDNPAHSSSSHFFGQKLHHNGAYDADKHAHFDHESEHEQEHDDQPLRKSSKARGAKRVVEIVFTWIRRSQVVLAYVVFLSGFTMYTGMCRAGLINSCAAHYIKGSIFFLYGVLTFGRYLGAYADLGWAWNKRPGVKGVSAEMIECAVIFTYGITNTWMERFGSGPEAPYTVKQVQHISIAVMFWFAGLSGMLLESRWVRKLLGSVISTSRREVQDPPSYSFSFNPLPALVNGVTGLAMAAHHQEYVFQVQIHSLWGTLLAGGSLFRFLTYFFLYLRPPTESELPSRPPTEILTSFGWAAGGIVFMLSNEEIAWAAIRAGWDDMMAFLNFTIALTSLIFCWSVVVMAIKGWAVLRLDKQKSAEYDQA